MGMVALILRLVKGQALTNAEVDGNFTNLNDGLTLAAADFYGNIDPATDPNLTVVAGMTWAHIAEDALKRRNDANDAWVVESVLFKRSLPEYDVAPLTNKGPIYLIGTGPAEWDSVSASYVPKSGGAVGGGANKVFYPNDNVITEDMTLTADKNWHSTGPLDIQAEVTVEGTWVIS